MTDITTLKAILGKEYEAYKKDWISANIDNITMCETEAAYENNPDVPPDMSFYDYVEKYGFTNGSCYANFEKWFHDTFVEKKTDNMSCICRTDKKSIELANGSYISMRFNRPCISARLNRSDNGFYIDAVAEDTTDPFYINFCPVCGRDLRLPT